MGMMLRRHHAAREGNVTASKNVEPDPAPKVAKKAQSKPADKPKE